MNEQQNIKNLINDHNRRLQLLKKQKALEGFDTPTKVILEIAEIEAELNKLQTNLDRLNQGLPPLYPSTTKTDESPSPLPPNLPIGDVVTGDKISTGNILGKNMIFGRKGKMIINQANDETESNPFTAIYAYISTRPEDPDVEKDELITLIQNLEQETAKGQQANPKKINRWLNSLKDAAEDVFTRTIAVMDGG